MLMVQKIQTFDAKNKHLPLKITGAVIGSVIVTAIVFLVVSALEDDEEYAEFDEAPVEEVE